MHASALLATALLAAASNAQTYVPPPMGYFVAVGFVPEEPGSAYIHAQELQARGGRFYVTGATNASCADGAASCCTPNDRTSFVVLVNQQQEDGTSGPTGLYLNTVDVEKGVKQQVYCSPGSGQLLYTPPGDLVPTDIVGAGNFSYKPEADRNSYGDVKNDDTTFSICDTDEGKQIYCKSSLPEGLTCIDTPIQTRPDFQGVAAGKYL